MKAEEILSSKDFRKCVEFHGHVCPGLAIGFKAAEALMAHLGVIRAPDEELVAIVETDACGSDAIQVMTGCTFGKGNLIFRNYGKHAFSLADRKQKKIFRASLRSDAIVHHPKNRSLAKKASKGEASKEELETLRLQREKRLKEILEADADRLFTIKEIRAALPLKAKLVKSSVCQHCGELTMVSLLRKLKGKSVCIPCAQKLGNRRKKQINKK